MGGAGPSPPASAGAAHVTPELTENTTAALDSAMPMALKGGNHILNLTLPTGLGDQELPAGTDSDVTSADSFGRNDDSTYLNPRENSPAIENTTLDLLVIIKETGNIFKVFSKEFEELNTPRVLFTQDDELNPPRDEEEATQTKTPLHNGGTPPLLTQSSSQSSPPVDASDTPYSSPLGVQ